MTPPSPKEMGYLLPGAPGTTKLASVRPFVDSGIVKQMAAAIKGYRGGSDTREAGGPGDSRPLRFSGGRSGDFGDRRCADEDLDALRVELRAGVPAKLLDRLVVRHRSPVGPAARHRVESVSDVEDPAGERDRLAAQPVRVTVTVDPLVRAADPGHDRLETLNARDHLGAPGRAGPNRLPFLFGERIALAQDVVRDRHLADVVEDGRHLEKLQIAFGPVRSEE